MARKRMESAAVQDADASPVDTGSTAAAELYSQRGLCVMERLLAPEHVAFLRRECDALRQQLEADGHDLINEQCVLEVPAGGVPAEGSAARTDADAYMQHRGMPDAAAAPSDAPMLARELLLEILPSAAGAAIARTEAGRQRIRLFNEHYVVKPAQGAGWFGWHTDAAHQHEAAAALLPESLGGPPALPEYVSLWCPLDDITDDNGCLLLLPADAPQPPGSSPDRPATEPTLSWLHSEAAPHVLSMRVAAGTAVLFSSRLWHCSRPNDSGRDRRVFYAQYSVGAIGGEARPLGLAVYTRLRTLPVQTVVGLCQDERIFVPG
jgi:hypothetical protein